MAFDEKLQGSLEDNVLTMLCWDAANSATVAQRVGTDLFSTRAYKKIADKAIEYLDRYGHPPRAHLRDLFEQELQRGEEGRFLSQILDAMDKLAPELQSGYVLEQLSRFVQIRRLTLQTRKVEDNLHVGNLEEAEKVLSEITFSADRTADDDSTGVWLHDSNRWLSFLDREEDEDLFSSGISMLDEKDVRPRRRSLFLVIAPSGRGKSFWLRQIARDNAIERNKKVLFITLENDLEETQKFMTMALLAATSETHTGSVRVPAIDKDAQGNFKGTTYNQLTPASLKPIHKSAIAQQLKPYQARGKLLCKWFPTGTLTINQLNSFLDRLERVDGFKPDMIVLDYPDLMQTDQANLRISVGRIFVSLRGIAGQRNLSMVAATQGNRISADARIVTAAMVAEDWSKVATADTICTYSQTPDEKEIGLARVLVAKSRRSADKWVSLITQSYATGQFCIDSCYFSKFVQKEIDRRTGQNEEDGE